MPKLYALVSCQEPTVGNTFEMNSAFSAHFLRVKGRKGHND